MGVHVFVCVCEAPSLEPAESSPQSHPWVMLGPDHSPRSGQQAVWPLATVTQKEDPKEQEWPPGHLTASDVQTGGRLASRGLGPHCYVVWVLGPPGVMGTRWQGQNSGHPEGGTKPPQLPSSPSRSSRSPKGGQEEVPTPEAWVT